MKHNKFLIAALAFGAAVLPACNDSQSDLLEPKLYFESNVLSVSPETDTYECPLSSRLSTPVASDVTVKYSVGGQTLVDKYNDRYGVTAQLLPAENYEFATEAATVPAGKTYADPCMLNLKNMDQVTEGATYVLPILVSTSDASLIPDNNVIFVVVKKPIRIYKAMQFGTYWLDVRLPTSFKNTGSVTYEALVYATSWRMLGTIMGNEGCLIMRTGDLGHPNNELQMAGNIAMQMPDANVWSTGKWYHVAFTYDAATGQANIYLNGESIANKNAGAGMTFDLNNRFCIGYAYDYDTNRKWIGYMSEVRLWNVARTANQLKENAMMVNPESEGLVGYWKLNGTDIEQRGDTWYIIDQTPNHNDATSNRGRRGENGWGIQYGEPPVVDVDVRL